MVTSAGCREITIYIDSPSDGDTVYTDTIAVSGRAMISEGAIVESVTVNGLLADGTVSWRKLISLQPGPNRITAEAIAVETERYGMSAMATISVNYNEALPSTPTGSISITTIPTGAEVYLDDSFAGITPCTLSEVLVGQHSIKLTKSGYFDAIRNVSVPADGLLNLHETLISCGYITISSNPPGASVYIDGNYTGETPKNMSKVIVGNHTIKLTKSDYDDVIIGNVSVSVGETLHLHENLTGYGSLSISSIPDGANVSVDGDYTGKTPLDIPKVVEGWHTIKLTKQDYADVEKMIHVSAGQSTLVGETLSVLEAAFISKIDLIAIFIALIGLIGLLIGIIIVKVSKRKRDAFSKSNMKEEDVRRHVESRQKIDFTKRKDIILLNSPEWTKHKDYAKINPLYKKAEELEKRGENKESIETYEKFIDINENYIKAWKGLERNYNALKESEKRYSALKKIRSIIIR
jgi:xanthosine utilization system XapX-like protein